jgi:hypothetical protein
MIIFWLLNGWCEPVAILTTLLSLSIRFTVLG